MNDIKLNFIVVFVRLPNGRSVTYVSINHKTEEVCREESVEWLNLRYQLHFGLRRLQIDQKVTVFCPNTRRIFSEEYYPCKMSRKQSHLVF